MNLSDYLHVFRARWKILVGIALATTALAALITALTTPTYTATTQLFVSTSQPDAGDAYQNSLFSAQRVTSYADLAQSRKVAKAVIQDLGLDLEPSELSREITATAVPDTVILEVSANAAQPREAQRLAQGVATEVTRLVAELETPQGQSQAPIKATIVEDAALPKTPVSPKPLQNLMVGVVLGLLLGLAAAVLKERLDMTVKSTHDLTEVAGLPVLGTIPFDPTTPKTPLLTAPDTHSPRSEAFRIVRTNMQFVDVDRDNRVYTVTSSVPEEGKTTTAANLAVMLAQAGNNVLLVEGDLRRPRIHLDQELEQAVGLTTVLVGRSSLEDAVQTCGITNLSVLTSGALPPNPTDLLQSQAMSDVLDKARLTYDFVIIDAPPLLPVADGALLSVKSDAVLLVVRHGKTTKQQLQHAVERVRAVGGRPLGGVLNMVSAHESGAYMLYGGGYGQEVDPGLTALEGASAAAPPEPGTALARATSSGAPRTAALVTDTDTVRVVPERHWDTVVRRLGGDEAYHSLEYHHASLHLEPEGTIPVLLHYRGRANETALPLLLRPLPDGQGWDATTPYGYGGPVSTSPFADPTFGPAMDEWATSNQLVASFLRFHPLLRNHQLAPTGARVSRAGHTATWDLEHPDLLQSMHAHHRRAARKADRAGLQIRTTSSPGDLSGFRALYETTMRRQGAKAFYFFADDYWEELTEISDKLLLFEGIVDGEEAAAILCFTSPPYLHYHLGASTEEGRRIGASNRLFLAAADWGASSGFRKFHLGGGLGGSTSSSLFEFKRRFDPQSEPLPFFVGKWVHDPARYEELTGGNGSTAGFFPPWRA